MTPFFLTVPHSGEDVPDEVTWLKGLDERVLMRDVDRFVDQLYKPIADRLQIPIIVARWHRYVVDLNRLPTDIDQGTVEGSPTPAGKFSRGFHWANTTLRETLMPKPISKSLHDELVKKYFEPFHEQVQSRFQDYKRSGHTHVFHLDCHSMPSVGTEEHRDPGQLRPDIVVSDSQGKSASPRFKDLVISAYEGAGFSLAYNWPYYGGRITETYGRPADGQHTIQVEMNRSIYMNEETKQLIPDRAYEVRRRLFEAIQKIQQTVLRSPESLVS